MTTPERAPVRFTHLKAMARSPQHYQHAVTCGRPDSAPLRLGRIVHWGVLGCMPDDEDGRVTVYDGERRGNAWKAFAAQHAGDEIVTAAEVERAQPIIAAVLTDPIAARVLEGEREKRVRWAIGDRDCASRVDVIQPGAHLTDLKTTTNTRPEDFMRLAWRMHYHAQLAFYSDAALHAGIAAPRAFIVGVETTAPHAVTVLRLADAVLEAGRREYRAWFERVLVCEASNDWPGYAQSDVPFDVPEWFESEDGDDEDEAAA